ncbi:DUF3267 domain-containing protein [Bacillus sp. S3]|uniref:DUF3267 domain-containing protein n=1 Tax=Bacillus sp. S3 TaxID=486398 RepID=UPI001CC1EE62|nr:DUF3267 domain-containing protein [Bacillus sp. S3]
MDTIKFTTKIPKFNEQTHIELLNDDWKQLKEPKSLTNAMLLSMPFMVINALISMGIIYFFSTFSLKKFSFISGDSFVITIDLGVFVAMVLVIVIHEFFHLIFIPNFLKSGDTVIGLTFYGAFVHTEQTVTKDRFLLITIAPFLFLSVFFPLFLSILGILTGKMLVFIILNSLGASLDILGFFLVLVQIPRNAVVRNNGTRTYWKMRKQ